MLIQKLLIPESYSEYSFTNFVAGANKNFIEGLQRLDPTASKFQDSRWLYGVGGSGKSHLLHALRHSWQDCSGNVALLRLQETKPHFDELVDFVIEHGSDYDTLLIDDAQLIVGDLRCERALYRLVNCAMARDSLLLIAGKQASRQMRWALNDTRTRMKLLPEQQLQSLTGAAVEAIAQRYAHSLGLFLSAPSWSYINRHYPRDMHKMYLLINILAHQNATTKSSPSVQQIKAIVQQL